MQRQSSTPVASFPDFVMGASEERDPCIAKTTLDAWDLLLLPETRGSFCITRRFLKTAGVLLTLEQYHSSLRMVGATRPATFHLLLPVTVSSNSTLFGRPLERGFFLASFDRAVDFDMCRGQSIVVVKLDLDILRQEITEEELNRFRDLTASRWLSCPLESLTHCTHALMSLLYGAPGIDIQYPVGALRSCYQRMILDLAIELLRSADDHDSAEKECTSLRRRGFERALQVIEDRAPEASTSVADLCKVAGVSQRTLEYAFLDYTNLTPKAYLKAKRYAELRRILATDRECLSVMEAASRLGIFEFGRMAGEYRKQFGELPSETLASRRT